MSKKDLTVQTDHGKLNIRVGGLCFQDGQILLQYSHSHNFWFPTGGRVQFGEKSKSALVRELKEELSLKKVEIELAAFVENFFEMDGNDYHEISPFYRVKLPENFTPPTEEEDGKPITLAWHKLADLQNIDVRPAFIKEQAGKLQTGFHHLITS